MSGYDMPPNETERPRRVFIVNGSPPFLEILHEFLTLESFEVVVSLNVNVEFKAIIAFDPDLLIVDIVAFEKQGWELLEHIHSSAKTNDIPVIIISTSEEILDRAKAQVDRYGGDYYLAKPLDLEELLSKVHQATSFAHPPDQSS